MEESWQSVCPFCNSVRLDPSPVSRSDTTNQLDLRGKAEHSANFESRFEKHHRFQRLRCTYSRVLGFKKRTTRLECIPRGEVKERTRANGAAPGSLALSRRVLLPGCAFSCSFLECRQLWAAVKHFVVATMNRW